MAEQPADAIAAVAASFDHLLPLIPGAWLRRDASVTVAWSGLPAPPMNSVVTADRPLGAAQLAAIETGLDELAATGMPYSLSVPDPADGVADIIARRGLVDAGAVPLMVLDDAAGIIAPEVGGVVLRRLAPDEGVAHAALAAAVFEAPPEIFAPMTSPAALAPGDLRIYAGEVDGTPVVTGLGLTLGGSTAVFNVATDPAYRRRGLGAALTALIVRDGVAAGAGWAWLQSSPDGVGVYVRLGFRTVDTWRMFVSG